MGIIELGLLNLAFETIKKVIDLLISDEEAKAITHEQLAFVEKKLKESEVA